MRHFDLFSGYGGFTLALKKVYARNQQSSAFKQDWKGRNGNTDEMESDVLPSSWSAPLCIGFSEIDKYASAVLKNHWPNTKNWGDIKEIRAEELPDFNLLTFGFPCQTFSIAGKRKGFEDLRGQLIYEVIRILR